MILTKQLEKNIFDNPEIQTDEISGIVKKIKKYEMISDITSFSSGFYTGYAAGYLGIPIETILDYLSPLEKILIGTGITANMAANISGTFKYDEATTHDGRNYVVYNTVTGVAIGGVNASLMFSSGLLAGYMVSKF